MKIHIIGAPGSGKSYLSKKLAKKFNIPLLELDQIHWNNSAESYNTPVPEAERNDKLEEFTNQDSWIVEGIYYKWTDVSFDRADEIIILDSPKYTRNFRIVKRFIQSKFGLAKCNEKSIKDIHALITWGNSYSTDKIPLIKEKTEPYAKKRYFFNNADEAYNFIGS